MFVRKRRNKSGTTSVVADSGLMSETNMSLLESAGYKYILGARIRNESPKVKEWLLGIDREEGRHIRFRPRTEYISPTSWMVPHLGLNVFFRNCVCYCSVVFQSIIK